MKKCIYISVFLISIFSANINGGNTSGPRTPQVKSYHLEIEVVPDAKLDYAGFIEILYGKRPEWNKGNSMNIYPYIKGKAEVTLDLDNHPSDSIVFYLHSELRVHNISFNNKKLNFNQKTVCYLSSYSGLATRVQVTLTENTRKQTITIHYGGVFNPNYSKSPSNYMRIDSRGAYLRSYGYSLWFPVFLDARKTTYKTDFNRVKIITPKKFIAVFTGNRLNESILNKDRISTWQALNTDLMDAQLTVRPFQIQEKKEIYLYHLDKAKSKKSVKDILHFISQLKMFYENHYRELKTTPQLHIAELPNYASGISSANMIGITSAQWQNFNVRSEDDRLKRLIAHELVHTYVQVSVNRLDPIAALVVEGFPSYFHLPALAELLGEEWYKAYIKTVEKAYMRKKEIHKTGRGNPLPLEKPILSLTFEDIGIYKDTFILNDRVILFLHYLRNKLGKNDFTRFTRELCTMSHLTVPLFKEVITKYIPGSKKDIFLWLETNEYPERMQLKK